jgi:hypothetical protein
VAQEDTTPHDGTAQPSNADPAQPVDLDQAKPAGFETLIRRHAERLNTGGELGRLTRELRAEWE